MAWKVLLIWSMTSAVAAPLLGLLLQRATGAPAVVRAEPERAPTPLPSPTAATPWLPSAVSAPVGPGAVGSARPALCAAIRAGHPSVVGVRSARRCTSRR